MTKRRIKNHGPAGFNKSLGSSLAPKNQRKNPQDNQNSTVNENVGFHLFVMLIRLRIKG